MGLIELYPPGLLPTDYIKKLTDGGYIFNGTYMTVVGTLSVLANLFVLVASIKYKLYKGRGDIMLTTNMAVSDLIISMSGHPMVAISGFSGRWVFGDYGCIIFAFMYFTLSMVSMNTLVAIGVYRYIMICKPSLEQQLSAATTRCVIVICWLYAVLCTCPPLLGWSYYTYESFGTSCSMNWLGKSTEDITYILFTCVFCFAGHIIVLTYCYFKISRDARSLIMRVARQTNTAHTVVLRMRELRTVTLVSLMVVIFFLSAWTPYAIISIIQIWTFISPEVAMMPTMGAKLSCLSNPLIISIFTKKYRDIMKNGFSACFFRRGATVAPANWPSLYNIQIDATLDIQRCTLRPPDHQPHMACRSGTISIDGSFTRWGLKSDGSKDSMGSSNGTMNVYEHNEYAPRDYMTLGPVDLAVANLPTSTLTTVHC